MVLVPKRIARYEHHLGALDCGRQDREYLVAARTAHVSPVPKRQPDGLGAENCAGAVVFGGACGRGLACCLEAGRTVPGAGFISGLGVPRHDRENRTGERASRGEVAFHETRGLDDEGAG